MTNQHDNFVNAFCPSVLMEAFAIEQSLRLLIDWTRISYPNRFDSEDYNPHEGQFIDFGFGGLVDKRLRDTDPVFFEEFSYRYNLLVDVPAGFEEIHDVNCLLTVITSEYHEVSEGSAEFFQYELNIGRFKHLYPFLVSDTPEKVLGILSPRLYKEHYF